MQLPTRILVGEAKGEETSTGIFLAPRWLKWHWLFQRSMGGGRVCHNTFCLDFSPPCHFFFPQLACT